VNNRLKQLLLEGLLFVEKGLNLQVLLDVKKLNTVQICESSVIGLYA